MKRRRLPALAVSVAVLGPLAVGCCADPRVIVSATADGAYTQRKYGGSQAKPESYVVMQGHFIAGCIVDKSVDRMPFRRIAEVLAPELARRQYWPATNAKDADLLIVVHWGTTVPPVSELEMRAQTSPMPDTSAAAADKAVMMGAARASGGIALGLQAELMNESARLMRFSVLEQDTDNLSNSAAYTRTLQLLGYTRFLHDHMLDADAAPLGSDLGQERYFIILKAYDLHAPTRAERSRAVWTLHLNMSAPGNDFRTALDRMSVAAINYVGRSTDNVETVRPPPREGKVEIGPMVSHGEVK